MKTSSSMKKLMEYAGSYRYLTYASYVLSAISALVALVPFWFIWNMIRRVLTAPDIRQAEGLGHNGWMAVIFALLSMVIYIAALWCSHLSAFRVQRNIRTRVMEHIVTLPVGFLNDWGSGKVRKIVTDCSAATETYLAHIWPDKAGMVFTPLGLIVLLLVFDWRLGFLCLVPVGIAFVFMAGMMGSGMQEAMKQYQNALETMSSEAVEYVREIEPKKLMDTVSFVFQNSRLFKMSILENVRLARPDATREEVLQALHDAQCDDILEKLPKGVDTVVGAKGIYVSGGEQQRLNIARVMLKNAPILILDEATAFADPDNEVRVQAAFEKMSRNKTVIMIAHRLSTVATADQIYVVKDGRIAEHGTHAELTSQDSLYGRMWKEYQSAAEWKVGEEA